MVQYLVKKYTSKENPESPSSPSKFESDLDESESESRSVQSLTLSESSDTSDEDLTKSLDIHEFHMYVEHCKKECANICSQKRKLYVQRRYAKFEKQARKKKINEEVE